MASAIVASSLVFAPQSAMAAASINATGWYETITAELTGIKADDVTAVSVSGGTTLELKKEDIEYLVRDKDNKVLIDIPGIKAGDNYTLSVTAGGQSVTASGITVYAHDRAGYAHKDAKSDSGSKCTDGIGGYTNDGELKDNAIVMYVTEENKNTVQVPGYEGDNYPKGIGNILNEKSAHGDGVLGGGKTNVIKALSDSKTPLVIRFVGTVVAGDSNTRDNPPKENINGLTGYNSTVNGGTVKDNGMVARVYKADNITFEGIGSDATIDGWGFQIIAQTGYPSQGFEFRNLNFVSTPEDAIGFEGTSSESSSPQTKEWITSPIRYCWVHNNTFYSGYCKKPAESDKAEGDGSVDFKRGYGYTMDYNHYISNHKTNLVGSSDKSIQYDVTFHHNYYEGVWSRQPLARQANIHIYNSYFLNGPGTSYIISARANTYIFSEANFYENCKNPIEDAGSGGVVKSYNDSFSGCTGENSAVVVSSKNASVSSKNPYAGFETKSDMYAYESTDAAQAKADCKAKAGSMKPMSEINMEAEPESIITKNPKAPLALPYELDFASGSNAGHWTKKTSESQLASGTTYDLGNALFTPTSKVSATSTNAKIKDNALIFSVVQPADIELKCANTGKYGLILYNAYGVAEMEVPVGGTGKTTVDAGTYVIKSSNIEKEAYIENFKAKAHSATDTTVEYSTVEEQTQPTTSQTPTSSQSKPEPPTEEETEAPPYTGSGLIWNYTSGENTLDAKISANDWSGAEPVSYGGTTLTRAIKMESDTDISFSVPGKGKLTIVSYSTNSAPTILLNNEKLNISKNGAVTVDVSGYVSIAKGTSSTYIYLFEFVGEGAEESTEAKTEATTASSTDTTAEQIKPDPDESSTEATTEDTVVLSVAKKTAKPGESVSVPVAIKGMDNIANYFMTISYDPAILSVDSVENGDVLPNAILLANTDTSGVILAAASNIDNVVKDGSALLNLRFTAIKAGTADLGITVTNLGDFENAAVENTASAGSVMVAAEPGTVTLKGDVDCDGDVDKTDAVILMRHISGIELITDSTGLANAFCVTDKSKGAPTLLDVYYILKNPKEAEFKGSIIESGKPLAVGDYLQGQIEIFDTGTGSGTDGKQWDVVENSAAQINNTQYANSVQGHNNPSPSYNSNGARAVPTAGSYVKITPKKDAKLVVDMRLGGGSNSAKHFAFISQDGDTVTQIDYEENSNNNAQMYLHKSYDVKAGETYYLTSGGTKIFYYKIALE